MGGIVTLCTNIVAVIVLLGKGSGLGAVAIASSGLSFWSLGVMRNYRENPEAIPPFWVYANAVSFFAGIGLLVAGLAL